MSTNLKKKYALLSVFDKSGIVEFAKLLRVLGFEIISTGGTAKVLKGAGVKITPIEDITGNPESFDGRMKTISFQIESGILFDRTNPTHRKEAKKLDVKSIDIVVCNLYPFEETIAKKSISDDEAIEQIDVGGPTMIRAAAKNFKNVVVVTSPNDYVHIGAMLQKKLVTLKERKNLAAQAFHHLSYYDSQIARYLDKELFPKEITIPAKKVLTLRYGENPHQSAAVFIDPMSESPFAHLAKVSGRDLSLTNLTDINAGIESVRMFHESAAVIIKHNSPCGIALGATISTALSRAIESDPESAFGGIIVVNKKFDKECVKVITAFKDQRRGNIDIVAVPGVDQKSADVLKILRKTMGIYTFGAIKKNPKNTNQIKWIDGGFVLQTGDYNIEKNFKEWKVVTKKKPTAHELNQMKIAWQFISRIKSNSILVMDRKLPMTRGIGTGQTSRIRSTKLALSQAGKFATGAVMASDSFFPFDDSVRLAATCGISAIVQQGGSINDKMSIAAADEAGIAMVFTGRRAFWH